MVELVRSNDLFYLSWVEATLAAAGIESLITDQHTSVLEGSIGAIPRRLLVDDRNINRARHFLEQATAELGGS
jgi:hypothetical protein